MTKENEMSEWQPIETAPKDGTPVDLWHKDGFRMTETWWDTQDDCWSCAMAESQFTHWKSIEPPDPDITPQVHGMSEMTDRLRTVGRPGGLCEDAANEIERLQKRLALDGPTPFPEGYDVVDLLTERLGAFASKHNKLQAENTALKAKLEKVRGARKRVPFAIVGGEVRYLLDEDCDDPKARRIVFADELEAALK